MAALAVMTSTACSLDKACSRNLKSNPGADNPGEQAELLKKFAELNPEAQRGALAYIEKMRKGYEKGLTKIK
ncbi:MAG: hypothetical protein HWN68_20840 [Desulfobacterales bacterium]|nr:hypothetical protein [Desulfobacterales bacterium]